MNDQNVLVEWLNSPEEWKFWMTSVKYIYRPKVSEDRKYKIKFNNGYVLISTTDEGYGGRGNRRIYNISIYSRGRIFYKKFKIDLSVNKNIRTAAYNFIKHYIEYLDLQHVLKTKSEASKLIMGFSFE